MPLSLDPMGAGFAVFIFFFGPHAERKHTRAAKIRTVREMRTTFIIRDATLIAATAARRKVELSRRNNSQVKRFFDGLDSELASK